MDIYPGQKICDRWPVDRPRGWNAGLTDPGPMCGGGIEVQVTRGQRLAVSWMQVG